MKRNAKREKKNTTAEMRDELVAALGDAIHALTLSVICEDEISEIRDRIRAVYEKWKLPESRRED